MAVIPGFTYTQTVSVVANNVTAINNEIIDKAADGFAMTTLVDKPDSDEVYLTFAKNEATVEV